MVNANSIEAANVLTIEENVEKNEAEEAKE